MQIPPECLCVSVSTVVATTSWSTFEGTLKVLCRSTLNVKLTRRSYIITVLYETHIAGQEESGCELATWFSKIRHT